MAENETTSPAATTSDEEVVTSERQDELFEQVGDDPHGEAGQVFLDGAPRPKYETAQDELDEQSPVTVSTPGARVDTVESPHPDPEAVADKPM